MAIAVQVDRATCRDDLANDLWQVRALANSLDARFSIAGFKIGWDAIIGVVPVIGDTITALIGIYPIIIARKHRLGGWLQFRMAMNILLDWAIGEVPLIGDFFDAAFKSNIYNADLLERAAKKATASDASRPTS